MLHRWSHGGTISRNYQQNAGRCGFLFGELTRKDKTNIWTYMEELSYEQTVGYA